MGKEKFDNIPSKVFDLLTDVKNGRIGLPDLQRPFVWKDAKIRDLLDSMLKGYPIGYIMLWASPINYSNAAHIGKNDKIYAQPDDLVIDGQQRLTALLAAMFGIPVRQEHTISKLRRAYIKGVNEARTRNGQPELSDDELDAIEANINDLLNLSIYSLPTLKISAKADEEDVADIFVRVNSGGQNLNENNFIETLMAVYDNEVHDKINRFCAESRVPADHTSYNHILTVTPSHIIRMTVASSVRACGMHICFCEVKTCAQAR